MAKIIDFTAKLNDRRAKAETARRDQAAQNAISEHLSAAGVSAANGDAKGMFNQVAAAIKIQDRDNRPMPAYCDPANDRRGSKYEATKGLYASEIPALMRADIKSAVKRGLLPKGLKISVRRDSYSGGCSIDMGITAVPSGIEVYNPEFLRWTGNLKHETRYPADYDCAGQMAPLYHVPGGRYTPEVTRYLEVLKEIHGAYQRNNSDSSSDYFNVRYYGDASISSDLERSISDALKEAK